MGFIHSVLNRIRLHNLKACEGLHLEGPVWFRNILPWAAHWDFCCLVSQLTVSMLVFHGFTVQ